ncbi:hypothetical protein Dda_1392 [Drechslerella dactyloides]|uniref:Antiviral helicase n=1 Tax=Drechslerella dactyloides TaxID=74499 RepID=A0AAD6J1Y2_DREDA|nr:hypothetical protein Dda_1392 [Drechslerella dactyloides]
MEYDVSSALAALKRLDINLSQSRDPSLDIDTALHLPKARAPLDRSEEDILRELENDFLTPQEHFPVEWLNRLQERWDDPPDYYSLFALAPTMTRTVIRFTREGLEGRVTGYKEVSIPAQSITAKNSTSLLRKPGNKADFVRGKAGFFPFSPGGLDVGTANERAEDLEYTEAAQDAILNSYGTLQVAPGLLRGLKLEDGATDADGYDPELFQFGDLKPIRKPTETVQKDQPTKPVSHAVSELEAIDDLLPVEFPFLAPRGPLASSSAKSRGKEWAHMVDINQDLTNFRELVPNMAREWPFELDNFQKEAVYHLENGDSVFVAAHTSAGKTVVAEYAIALASKHMTKAIYTSPIKALSNQKFRDFRGIFEDVGILTGDVQINPEASCLIMTTEILRSMLYRGADLIRDVEFVIFDEVHYVNDQERGVVWEEVIIMLPDHVNLILLSATVPNTYEFATWVGRTKKKDIYVISTPKRPVPLEHYLWAGNQMHKIVDQHKKFLETGWKAAGDAMSGKKDERPKDSPQGGRGGSSQRGGQRGGQYQRGGQGHRGGKGPNMMRGISGASSFNRGGRGGRTTANQDKNLWVHSVQYLKKEDLLPGCIFVFSKKRCEENADALSNLDYCTANEKSAIHMIVEKSIARLRVEDRQLPQIRRLRDLLARGIAVHHGGLLPIVKEMVEILFAKSLVKVLFATETFAMGLNLPTRTVVFSGIRKHDGRSFRDLLSGEYIQMAGRAGRRGLDSSGTVIIVGSGDEVPASSTLKTMILGQPTKLQSQFRLTYNMILNLLRVEALKIEEMIKRSFSENATQTLLPEHQKMVSANEEDLKRLTREDCSYCNEDLDLLHNAAMDYKRLTQEMHALALKNPQGKRMFASGRVIIIQDEKGTRTVGALIRTGSSLGNNPFMQVMKLTGGNDQKIPSDVIPFNHLFASVIRDIGADRSKIREAQVPLSQIEYISKTVVETRISEARTGRANAVRQLALELKDIAQNWGDAKWNENDWTKIRDMQFQEVFKARRVALQKINKCKCLACPNFTKHFRARHEEYKLQEEIRNLKQLISDQNLQLLPDYEQRILVLQDLQFIDEDARVQLKGRVACEINSTNELVLTELILENTLADFEPEEMVALLSAFVFQEKTDTTPVVPPKLERGKEKILEIASRVNEIQTKHQVLLNADTDDFESRPRFGLMEVVYEWAKGMTFERITDLTDVLEGTIVRVITRLDETCREVRNAARIIGDPALYQKAEKCQEMIRRDIISCGSLYF